jgi:hypothetical protein
MQDMRRQILTTNVWVEQVKWQFSKQNIKIKIN